MSFSITPSHFWETIMRHSEKHAVFVIPAFQGNFWEWSELEQLHTKEDVVDLWHANRLWMTHLDQHPPSHRPTDYSQWISSSEMYEIPYQPFYEPYVVMRKTVPSFSEWFRGYGHDKSSFFLELFLRGCSFYVLPDGFLLHWPHIPSQWALEALPSSLQWRRFSFWWNHLTEELGLGAVDLYSGFGALNATISERKKEALAQAEQETKTFCQTRPK